MMATTTRAKRSYSPQQREQFEQERRQTLEELHNTLAKTLGTLSAAHEWQSWLKFASGFHQYSMNNSILIMIQSGGTATAVAGYRAWQAKGRQVRSGEKAIRILAPVIKRLDVEDRDGNPVRDESGKPRKINKLVGVRIVSVFDITATDGPPAPERPTPQLLTGQAPEGLWDALAAVAVDEGYTISRGNCGGANGWARFDTREIRVRDDVDDVQACKTLAHEIGHILLGHEDRNVGEHRGINEVEAESVAFMVLERHGVDSRQYTFNYVVGWAESAATPETPVEDIVRRTGERVIAIADKILTKTLPQPGPAGEAIDALAAATIGPDLRVANHPVTPDVTTTRPEHQLQLAVTQPVSRMP